MTCPKCGQVQQKAKECLRCGVIIDKYMQLKASENAVLSSVTFYDVARDRKQIWLLAFLILIFSFLVYRLWISRDIKYSPGILIHSEPQQVMIKNPKAWLIGARVFVPLAKFSLEGRVLSSERYYFDPVSDISPIDLALGWGPMSNQSILDQLEIGQGSRRFVLLTKGPLSPLPMGMLLAHSSNMHMLPANNEIKEKIYSVHTGDLITLKGYLVGIQERGQWTWFSSLSRTDTGDGACEIVWVEQFERLKHAAKRK